MHFDKTSLSGASLFCLKWGDRRSETDPTCICIPVHKIPVPIITNKLLRAKLLQSAFVSLPHTGKLDSDIPSLSLTSVDVFYRAF